MRGRRRVKKVGSGYTVRSRSRLLITTMEVTWEVAVSGISDVSEVKQAYKRLTEGKSNQRW